MSQLDDLLCQSAEVNARNLTRFIAITFTCCRCLRIVFRCPLDLYTSVRASVAAPECVPSPCPLPLPEDRLLYPLHIGSAPQLVAASGPFFIRFSAQLLAPNPSLSCFPSRRSSLRRFRGAAGSLVFTTLIFRSTCFP